MSQLLWEQLIKLIARRIGFYIRQQDLQSFQHKIEERIKKLKLTNVRDYYNLLNNDDFQNNLFCSIEKRTATEEWKTLANIITNGESFFFRDRGQFELLTNIILPEIIASKREAYNRGELPFLIIKVWSAGCSTGEEVYSLAMLISELIPDPAQWHIAIIGTDINQKFLDLARQGIYKKWSFRLTDPVFKTKYFMANEQHWQIRPHLKSMVTFYYDNLVDVNNISHHSYELDLVLCRNVFIYFDIDSISKAVTKIASTLRYGGYLITGHAELQTMKLNNFQSLSFSESIIYKYLGNERCNIYISEHDISNKNNSLNYNSLLKQANNLLVREQKPLVDSVKQVEKVRENSSLPQPSLEPIKTLLNESKYDLVIEQAQSLIQQHNSDRELYYLIAQAYANQGNLERSKEYCDRALSIDSIYIEPLFLLAQIAEEQNKYDKAKEFLKRIIYLEPLSINAYLDLGAIYNSLKENQKAKKMYQNAYEILQKLPQNQIISDRKKTRVRDMLNYIKRQL